MSNVKIVPVLVLHILNWHDNLQTFVAQICLLVKYENEKITRSETNFVCDVISLFLGKGGKTFLKKPQQVRHFAISRLLLLPAGSIFKCILI